MTPKRGRFRLILRPVWLQKGQVLAPRALPPLRGTLEAPRGVAVKRGSSGGEEGAQGPQEVTSFDPEMGGFWGFSCGLAASRWTHLQGAGGLVKVNTLIRNNKKSYVINVDYFCK